MHRLSLKNAPNSDPICDQAECASSDRALPMAVVPMHALATAKAGSSG